MCGLLPCRNALKGKGWVLLLCVPWVMLGCGDFDREYGAGGADDSGSLWNVEFIAPTYFDESNDGPAQVDVVRDNCAAAGEEPDPEPFSDHFAEVGMTNRPLNNSVEQTASWIYLQSYEMHYSPVTQGTGAPLLTYIVNDPEQTVGFEPCEPGGSCSAESFIALYVPIRVKDELYQFLAANPTVDQLQYNVHYIFYGENDYGEKVSTDGFSTFLALDYDNCSG